MEAGKAAGEAAAAAMIAFRQGDAFMEPFIPTIETGAGKWRPLGWPTSPAYDPDPWVRKLKPFLIKSPSQFRAAKPPALTSDRYTKDFNEVKELGELNSSTRTDDETKAAVFWQFPTRGALEPAGAWPRGPFRARPSRRGSPLRADKPRRSGRGNRLLGKQVPLHVLATESCDSRSRHRR